MGVERVLIVGGGIAGLAIAGGLTRAGVECVIAEHAETWRPVGAGIILNVNAMAALRMLGLANTIEGRGFRLAAGAITDRSGRDLARTNFEALEPDFGTTIAIHRAELHTGLLEGASDAEIILGTTVERISQSRDGVDARLTNGREERFDLVIGADGLRSRVRELAFGDVPVEYAGYTCWRFVVEAPLEQQRMCEMWGRGKRFGVVPIGQNRFYVFAVANAVQGTNDPGPRALERFRERFSDFGGPAPVLLEALQDPDKLIHNDLCAVPAGSWSRNRVVLIGDAAHAMTPNMGQGAGMALEDAAVLAELLKQGHTVGETFVRYRERRESRVSWVQNQSRRVGQIGQLESAIACGLRNLILKMVPDRVGERTLRKLVNQPI